MLRYADGSTYEGEFLEGKRHGRGKLKLSNGDFYEGQFRNGAFNGTGKYTFGNAQAVKYEGEFVNGQAHGEGKITHLQTGSVYTGKFVNNMKQGAC